MKTAVNKLASKLGYSISRIHSEDQSRAASPLEWFHSDHYLRHNSRRLEHLASLGIPVEGKRVLEVGAGIGDHSSYYLDRGCDVTITEARPENIAILKSRFPDQHVFPLDLDRPTAIPGTPFDVVHSYGLLYHLQAPEQALQFMSENCSGILFLETCVSFGAEAAVNLVGEPQRDPTQAYSGEGCRPTRSWVFGTLQKLFPNVYVTVTQPNHEEFPLDWNSPEKHKTKHGLQRSVFVASREAIQNESLSKTLLNIQIRAF